MAAVTHLGTTFTTASGTKTVTATPAVNDLIIIITAHTGNTSDATPTDDQATSPGYVQIAGSVAVKATSADKLAIYVRKGLIKSASSTIFSHAPGGSTGGGLTVLKVTGMTRNDLNAILQSSKQDNQGAATPAPVFGSAAKTGNVIIGAVFNGTNTATLTPRSSPAYSEDTDSGYNSPPSGLEVMHINSGETGTTITWGSASVSAFCSSIIELDTTIPFPPLSNDIHPNENPTFKRTKLEVHEPQARIIYEIPEFYIQLSDEKDIFKHSQLEVHDIQAINGTLYNFTISTRLPILQEGFKYQSKDQQIDLNLLPLNTLTVNVRQPIVQYRISRPKDLNVDDVQSLALTSTQTISVIFQNLVDDDKPLKLRNLNIEIFQALALANTTIPIAPRQPIINENWRRVLAQNNYYAQRRLIINPDYVITQNRQPIVDYARRKKNRDLNDYSKHAQGLYESNVTYIIGPNVTTGKPKQGRNLNVDLHSNNFALLIAPPGPKPFVNFDEQRKLYIKDLRDYSQEVPLSLITAPIFPPFFQSITASADKFKRTKLEDYSINISMLVFATVPYEAFTKRSLDTQRKFYHTPLEVDVVPNFRAFYLTPFFSSRFYDFVIKRAKSFDANLAFGSPKTLTTDFIKPFVNLLDQRRIKYRSLDFHYDQNSINLITRTPQTETDYFRRYLNDVVSIELPSSPLAQPTASEDALTTYLRRYLNDKP